MVSAAWLHDVLDKKMIKSDREYKEKDSEIRSLLAKLFTAEEAQLIMAITENVSYSNEVKSAESNFSRGLATGGASGLAVRLYMIYIVIVGSVIVDP